MTVALPEVAGRMKSGREVNVTAAECAICAASVPAPVTENEYAWAVVLLTVTVKAAPPVVGVTLVAGPTVHVGGAPAPHARFTALLYPLNAVKLPLKTAVPVTCADREGLLMANR